MTATAQNTQKTIALLDEDGAYLRESIAITCK